MEDLTHNTVNRGRHTPLRRTSHIYCIYIHVEADTLPYGEPHTYKQRQSYTPTEILFGRTEVVETHSTGDTHTHTHRYEEAATSLY
jgi:hypothetical protein